MKQDDRTTPTQYMQKSPGDGAVEISMNLYDQEELHRNCTVHILRNSYTGQVSIGWWDNDNPPKGWNDNADG